VQAFHVTPFAVQASNFPLGRSPPFSNAQNASLDLLQSDACRPCATGQILEPLVQPNSLGLLVLNLPADLRIAALVAGQQLALAQGRTLANRHARLQLSSLCAQTLAAQGYELLAELAQALRRARPLLVGSGQAVAQAFFPSC